MVMPYEVTGSQAPMSTERSLEQSLRHKMSAKELQNYIKSGGAGLVQASKDKKQYIEKKRSGVVKNQA